MENTNPMDFSSFDFRGFNIDSDVVELLADEEELINEEMVADLMNGEMEYENENEDNEGLMFTLDAENEINQEFF
uniref:Uncharacterized protein n=1 Tax=Acrobeloides nanus TaxID=290746 RepID=A0A914CD77_9BILA